MSYIRCTVVLTLIALAPAAWAAEPPVYVLLWFDTEDYILPASDDAALRIAEWLTKENIRATFKVVGEKARTLDRRGRSDVVAALKKHEIGYHSNYHSVQPTPAVYLNTLGWDEGVAEFDRRERPGFDDVARIFGQRPTCYGQPGSSWGPQTFAAMKQWGMACYLDAGRHVDLDGRPHYYGGLPTFYKLDHTIRADLKAPDKIAAAEDRFMEAVTKLRAEGGGVVSTVYHPCEFAHLEFWDGVNFRNGANPPRESWKLPQQQTEAEMLAKYEVFFRYVRFMKRIEGVRFVTASEAAELYRDDACGRRLHPKDLRQIATAVGDAVNWQSLGDLRLTAGEVFAILNDYVSQKANGSEPTAIDIRSPLGPTSPPARLVEPMTVDASQFRRTADDVSGYLVKHGRVPGSVWLGSVPVPPESYLTALARVAIELLDGKSLPARVEVRPATLKAAEYVSADDPRLWGWVIFPPNFRAPALMELAKWQAWTLKPAVLHPPSQLP